MTSGGDAERGLSIRAYAAHRRAKQLRGGTRSAVEKALRTGRIHKNGHGKIDPSQADAEWEQSTGLVQEPVNEPVRPSRARRATPRARSEPTPNDQSSVAQGAPSYGQSRAIREAYQARLSRLDYEQRTGQLIKTDEVRIDAFQAARQLRDRLLTIPRRLAAELAAEADARTVERTLDGELRRALEDLADGAA